MRLVRMAGLTVALLGVACAKQQADTAATPQAGAAPSTRRSTSVITSEELSETNAQNAYYAIQMLRPGWFRSRARTSLGAGGAADPMYVYLDNTRYGTIQSLQQMSLSGIAEIRYMDASEATNRFGTGHAMGAIVIKLKQ